jgi:hypothetical protein
LADVFPQHWLLMAMLLLVLLPGGLSRAADPPVSQD